MAEQFVTAVDEYRSKRRWKGLIGAGLATLLLFLGLAVVVAGIFVALRVTGASTPRYADDVAHFKYGSIGSEPESGIPYAIWKTLPGLFPAEFEGRNDYSAFGLLYEKDQDGAVKDLPIGVSRRQVNGVDVVWLNCATCHTGTWRATASDQPNIVPGMPSNNLDFGRFVAMLLKAAEDENLAPDKLFPAIEASGAHLDWLDKLIWRAAVLPRFREGLIHVRSRLAPLQARQSPWGPGRVDTFNPYKLIQFDGRAQDLAEAEVHGVSDFPSIFNQGPRAGMELHWDGNNASLQERNLSAAIGAGVTPQTVDHSSIERNARWLQDLHAPATPHKPDPDKVAAGREIYSRLCAACHGRQETDGFLFEGEFLGKVSPITLIGTDPARLDSYTTSLRDDQLTRMFAGGPYRFTHFRKTNGYANQPLDVLWLRGPYLHNGSVPTLSDLLKPPAERPRAFLRGRGQDVIDTDNGGFVHAACTPAQTPPPGTLCFDTTRPGNGNGGHLYGVDLTPGEKADLVAYLLTF